MQFEYKTIDTESKNELLHTRKKGLLSVSEVFLSEKSLFKHLDSILQASSNGSHTDCKVYKTEA